MDSGQGFGASRLQELGHTSIMRLAFGSGNATIIQDSFVHQTRAHCLLHCSFIKDPLEGVFKHANHTYFGGGKPLSKRSAYNKPVTSSLDQSSTFLTNKVRCTGLKQKKWHFLKMVKKRLFCSCMKNFDKFLFSIIFILPRSTARRCQLRVTYPRHSRQNHGSTRTK